MLLIEADGVARTLEEFGVSVKANRDSAPQALRFDRRRSRFLARRKAGNLGLRLVVNGKEIIARR